MEVHDTNLEIQLVKVSIRRRSNSDTFPWHQGFRDYSCLHIMPNIWHGIIFTSQIMRLWKEFNRVHLSFASDPRNIRLGLCTDGFCPFDMSSNTYSCWQVIVTVYNLPPWKCMTRPFMFLSMIIPGLKNPGKKLDVFLRPLIDELKNLWFFWCWNIWCIQKGKFSIKGSFDVDH